MLDILAYEQKMGIQFDAILMHDSEDVIHPKALQLINHKLDRFDYIQIPVFSLEVKLLQLVAGTYMDEFAEYHTKDVLVRNGLNAAVPSAGVGTALSRQLVLALTAEEGNFLNEGSLTEDYELGQRVKQLNFQPHFACASFLNDEGKKEFIATREYFPKEFRRSIRQKTRWTTGIVFQGWQNLGWKGSMVDCYFLWRDSKGPLANLLVLIGYVNLPIFLLLCWGYWDKINVGGNAVILLEMLKVSNTLLMFNRLLQRCVCTYRVYGWEAVPGILLRIPLSNIINGCASISSIKQIVVISNCSAVALSAKKPGFSYYFKD